MTARMLYRARSVDVGYGLAFVLRERKRSLRYRTRQLLMDSELVIASSQVANS